MPDTEKADWSESPKWLIPHPTPEDGEFWAGAHPDRSELRIQHCTSCGKHQHYARMLCSHCGKETLEWVTATGTGTMYSFTVIRQNGVPPFNERLPFVVATVDLDEDGARMIAAMPDLDPDDAQIGMRVAARFRAANDEYGFVDFAARVKALDGRPLGKRGAQTRQRLLDATASLLETHGVRDLRVVEIAREVGASPGTFYQYFRDVEDAVLACSAEIGSEIAPLAALLDTQWTDTNGLDAARLLVEGFLDHWDQHRAVLRTRNLAAQEGDPRFREVRNAANAPFLAGFARQIVDPDLAPLAASAALVALLERMAAFHTELEPMGIPRTDLVETTARIVYRTVVGL